MAVLKNSESSRRFSALALPGVIALLTLISATASWWCLEHGYVLYFGDAEAHLNIARRILDSRTPGPEQIGTGWLPLPHVLMIPFVSRDSWWRSGLAGSIPSSACFIVAGAFLFAAARRTFGSNPVALCSTLLFALNPNMLYLQATPMTEPLFVATVAALLWATLWFRDSQSLPAVLAAAIASNAASLTRYEGWFLIPFVSLYILLIAKRKWHAVLFGALATLAPLAWIAHNRFYYGNALEFYNGPWSAIGIYRRSLAQGMPPYPGDHDWRTALHYYLAAGQAVVGTPVFLCGIPGALVALWKRAWWPLLFLTLAPAFYVWSMHSSGTPIFIPTLWPHSYYNSRYAIALLLPLAFAAGALLMLVPTRIRTAAAVALVAVPMIGWLALQEPPVCWKESEVNSIARRQWTAEAARILQANYQPGTGIMFPFGDVTGVLREAGIPLREGLHEGNGPAWFAATVRPDFIHLEEWAIAFAGDEVSTTVQRGRHYALRERITVKDAPVVEIYQRQ
jgi:hypothetical protein